MRTFRKGQFAANRGNCPLRGVVVWVVGGFLPSCTHPSPTAGEGWGTRPLRWGRRNGWQSVPPFTSSNSRVRYVVEKRWKANDFSHEATISGLRECVCTPIELVPRACASVEQIVRQIPSSAQECWGQRNSPRGKFSRSSFAPINSADSRWG